MERERLYHRLGAGFPGRPSGRRFPYWMVQAPLSPTENLPPALYSP